MPPPYCSLMPARARGSRVGCGGSPVVRHHPCDDIAHAVAVNALLRSDEAAVERATTLSGAEQAHITARVAAHAETLSRLANLAASPDIAGRLQDAADEALALVGRSKSIWVTPMRISTATATASRIRVAATVTLRSQRSRYRHRDAADYRHARDLHGEAGRSDAGGHCTKAPGERNASPATERYPSLPPGLPPIHRSRCLPSPRLAHGRGSRRCRQSRHRGPGRPCRSPRLSKRRGQGRRCGRPARARRRQPRPTLAVAPPATVDFWPTPGVAELPMSAVWPIPTIYVPTSWPMPLAPAYTPAPAATPAAPGGLPDTFADEVQPNVTPRAIPPRRR